MSFSSPSQNRLTINTGPRTHIENGKKTNVWGVFECSFNLVVHNILQWAYYLCAVMNRLCRWSPHSLNQRRCEEIILRTFHLNFSTKNDGFPFQFKRRAHCTEHSKVTVQKKKMTVPFLGHFLNFSPQFLHFCTTKKKSCTQSEPIFSVQFEKRSPPEILDFWWQ